MRAGGKEERRCGDPQVSCGTVPGGRPWRRGGAPQGTLAWGKGRARQNCTGASWGLWPHEGLSVGATALTAHAGTALPPLLHLLLQPLPGAPVERGGRWGLRAARGQGQRVGRAPRCRSGGSGAARQPPRLGSAAPSLCPGTLACAKGEGACPNVLKCGPTCPRTGIRAPWQR